MLATVIQFYNSKLSAEEKFCLKKSPLTLIGYLNETPENALRKLLPKYDVVDYLGVSIFPTGKWVDSDGLTISEIPSAVGLTGTIQLLQENELFQSCKHKPFSNKHKKIMLDCMGNSICFLQTDLRGVDERHTLICEILGFPKTVDELLEEYSPQVKILRFASEEYVNPEKVDTLETYP